MSTFNIHFKADMDPWIRSEYNWYLKITTVFLLLEFFFFKKQSSMLTLHFNVDLYLCKTLPREDTVVEFKLDFATHMDCGPQNKSKTTKLVFWSSVYNNMECTMWACHNSTCMLTLQKSKPTDTMKRTTESCPIVYPQRQKHNIMFIAYMADLEMLYWIQTFGFPIHACITKW